ncbi:MAG: alpha/beta fold hydrolase [Pseudomonadota bacterium]|nr:alpha/beta fold hydrolase [Pseudomonadota bacterium]MDP1904315.1 alpha/beta fold hydrolase [Pseudomonadota bacterium]MDP2352399.1 alpha/beta fold hydrolase [Pseudomonadota bacterium]
MTAALLLASALAFLAGLNLLIRFGLRAPCVLETASLAQHGLAGREVRLPTVRGRKLLGWLLPGDADKPAPGVIVLHGWGANLEMMLPLARPIQAAGLTVLLIDARNHGGSDGDTFSSMPRFAEDLDAAVAWLKTQPEVTPEKIALVGHSVGAAAVLLSASRRDDLAGVISLAAFAHPETMMRRWLAGKGIPYIPLGWYVLRYVQYAIGHRFAVIAPINTIARVKCPVLLMHGSEDSTVPVGDAHAIHARRPGDWISLRVLPGEHDAGDELEQHSGELIAFLNQAFASTDKGTPA